MQYRVKYALDTVRVCGSFEFGHNVANIDATYELARHRCLDV